MKGNKSLSSNKEFSLSDIWYGRSLQLLLYLFALKNDGEALYGQKTALAGFMYIPAGSGLLPLDRELSPEEIEEKRRKARRRSGLVLGDEAVIEAWERGEEQRYIPLRPGKRSAADTFLK